MRITAFVFFLFSFSIILQINAQQWSSENDIYNYYNNEITKKKEEISKYERQRSYAQGLPDKDENGRTNQERVDLLVEASVMIALLNDEISRLEGKRSNQLNLFHQEQMQKQAMEAAKKKQEAQAKAAAEKAKIKDADQKAKKDAERAQYEAEKAQKKAEYEAEMQEWREKQRLANEEDERRRKAMGAEAAAKEKFVGQIKSQNRMNNLMDRHEEHQYNIDRTNPYSMNHEHRQRLGGDYSRARISSQNSQNSVNDNQSQMSNLLSSVKTKNTKQSGSKNLDELEKQLKELSDFLDQR